MLIEGLILGFLCGILRKGSLQNLAYLRLRKMTLVFVALCLQLGLDFAAGQQISLTWLTWPMHTISYILLFIFIYQNWNLPGMKWFALGTALNFMVIMANQGTMPVDLDKLGNDLVVILEQGLNATHSIMGEGTRLKLLGDVIYLPYPSPRRVSIGDLVLSVGIFLFLFRAMTSKYLQLMQNPRKFVLTPYSLKTEEINDKIV